MNFFVTGIGHSGTMWLAKVLDCPHESPDPRSVVIPHPYTPFPVERFWKGGDGYGEVNGMLRYHLSAQYPGKERLIPRRAFIRRDPKKIIASWMNDELQRKPWELASVCFEVLWHFKNLSEWAENDPGAVVFDLDAIGSHPARLAEVLQWAGKPRKVMPDDLKPVRPTPDRLKWFEWGTAEMETFDLVSKRVGLA